VRIVRFGRIVMLGVLWLLTGAGAAGAEKYAPVITPYVETDAQKQQMAKADEAYDKGDYEAAKRLLAPLVEAGHSRANNINGMMYLKGFGYQKNASAACKYFEKAALKGYASAQWNTSICYSGAEGRKVVNRKYRFWVEVAAQNGKEFAQAEMAGYYYKTNKDKFLYWSKKAAAQGNVYAKTLLWGKGYGHLVPDLTWTNIACGIVIIGFFDMGISYCE
jgi:TPR repeat protein